MRLKKEHIIIFIIMVTEVLGFSLILPFLPFFAQELGAAPFTVGLIFMSFSFFQFLSAPIMGRLSDHYGRRPLLILSQFSTFIGFLVLGFSNALWMIFLSRIIDGLLGSNFTIAQAYISDISSKQNRSKAFSFTGAAFGFGFLIGPAIGGFLSTISYSLPAFIAAGFSLLTITLTYFLLPETIVKAKDVKLNGKMFHIQHYKKYFANKLISSKLWLLFTYILTHAIFVSTYALYAERQLNFKASQVGYILAYVGFMNIILRTALFPRLVDKFGENKLQYMGIISLLLSMIGMIFVTQWQLFLIVITLFAYGGGVLRPVIVGNISRNVSEKEQGSILGVTSSLQSISQIIGPLIGGFIIQNFVPGSLGIVGTLIVATGFLIMLKAKKY